MTAVEYERIYGRFMSWFPIPTFFLAIVVGVLTFTMNEKNGAIHIESIGAGLFLCLPALAVIPAVAVSAYYLQKRFERRHPEMKHLWDWCSQIGTVENYPTNLTEQIAQASLVRVKLEDPARRANAAIVARRAIEALQPRYANSSPEGGVLCEINQRLARTVNAEMQLYNERWSLLERMRYDLRVALPTTDPRQFRVSLMYPGDYKG